MQSAIYQLEIDMDPKYVKLPKGSCDSLGHQYCLQIAYWGSTPHYMTQVKLITALTQTTTIGLPNGWELVNQVGVIPLFTENSFQWPTTSGFLWYSSQ